MFEFMGLLVLAATIGFAVLGLLFLLWLVKIAFKIVLIPVGLALGLVKVILGLVFVVLLFTVGLPFLFLALLVAPLVLIGLLFWGGVCALGAFA